MRSVICALTALVALALPALADAVSIREVAREFGKHGATSVEMAYLDSHPVIIGNFKGQGFTATLRDCFDGMDLCYTVTTEACRTASGFDRTEALDFVNRFNLDLRRGKTGVAYVDDARGAGQVLCVRHRSSLREDYSFGIDQVFAFEQLVDDFHDMIEAREKDRQVRSILGKEMP